MLQTCRPCSKCCWRLQKTMLRSVVTVAKVTLVFLNIWVMAVVLVVSLGHWRVFDSSDPRPGNDNSHLIVMRELKVESDGRIGSRFSNVSISQNPNLMPEAPIPQLEVPTKEPFVEILNVRREETTAEVPATTRSPNPTPIDTRISTLRYWCKQQHPQKTPFEKIPKEKLSSILVDEHHKFLFCQIPGVAINEWRKILLILNGIVNVTNVDSISGGDVFGKYAKLPKRLDEYNEKRRGEMLKTYFKATFVRDPLERLVIAYKTKLLSKGSKYFHKAFGSQIIKKYRKKATAAEIKDGTSVKFSEFAKFIIDNEHSGVEQLNEHWGQYYKQCHPCLVDYDFVGTFENVEKDTKFVIDRLKAGKMVKSPYITDNKVVSQKDLKKIYSEVTVRELNNLFKIYAADYTLFGYQCPSFVHELLKKENILHDY